MGATEYTAAAQALRDHIEGMSRREATAVACRGSGDPAALAWLAEALELEPGQKVLDVGGGTGGPAAWLVDHYDVDIVVADPSVEALAVAADVFGLPTIAMSGTELAVADHFDAAIALGVVSVIDDKARLLDGLRHLTDRIGLLVWCASGTTEVTAGGSVFPVVDDLCELLERSGWILEAGPEAPDMPTPPSWRRLDEPEAQDDEEQVTDVIEAGEIHPRLLVSHRAEAPDRRPDGA